MHSCVYLCRSKAAVKSGGFDASTMLADAEEVSLCLVNSSLCCFVVRIASKDYNDWSG